MMTRRDFQALADALADARNSLSSNEWYKLGQSDMYDGLVKSIGDVCMASNGRFDRGRFEYAAGVR